MDWNEIQIRGTDVNNFALISQAILNHGNKNDRSKKKHFRAIDVKE